jgi:hypothetical protein
MTTRTAESIAKVARKNPVSRRTWWIAAIAGSAAAGIGLIAYVVTRPGLSLQVSIPTTLKAGEQYKFVMTAKSGTPTSSAPNQTAIQQFLDSMAPGQFQVVSTSVASQPLPTLTVVFNVVGQDYSVGQIPASVEGNIAAQGITSLVVTDLGPSGPITQLQPGYRYGLTLACPMPLPTPLPTDNTSATSWLNIPGATVVSFKQTSLSSVAVQFDFTGASAITVPLIQVSGATACTTQFANMGPTPQA